MRTILVVFGTRPEAIKLAPVIRALERHPGEFRTRVCVTGQHREMLDQVLDLFAIDPDIDLRIMRDAQSLSDVTIATLRGLEEVLRNEGPDWVVVQGDTTTTMAASLASFYAGIPVAHVEAGLRTGCMDAPRPEEMNRRVVSVLADLHFAPTSRAVEHLLREGIDAECIHLTGNTVVDAFHDVERLPAEDLDSILGDGATSDHRLILVTMHRRENHGRGIVEICGGLREIAAEFPDVRLVLPVHLNPTVSSSVEGLLGDVENVTLVAPLGYRALVHLLRQAHFVVTDSGGLQEEAVGIGKPVLVLRETTERPEGVEAGLAQLVGSDRRELVTWARRLLNDPALYARMAAMQDLYGDGHAADRIVAVLRQSPRAANGRLQAPKTEASVKQGGGERREP